MSNFGDQARLPTDRPPDSRNMDGFPKTKTILWDKTGIGKPTYLHLCYFRKPRVCIPEKILKLIQHQCENYGQKNHTLIGTLIVEDDGEAVQFQVDRLDTRPIMSADISANLAPGDLLIPLEVTNNTAGKRRGSVDDFATALKRLQERCCCKSSIDLSNFVLLRGWVSFYSNAHSSVAHMDFDMVTMGTMFKATPIANVPIVLTALSKNLAGPMSLSHTQGTPKSGYLTMDHARKLLLVLESDPKAGTLPIVGIWISGVEFVQHSFVWAACLRYIHNTHLQDRVCTPPEDFLLVLYSPLHSRPEFYQCVTTTGENKLMYELYCGHEVCNHTKSLSSQSDDFTEVELASEQTGDERALFDAAIAKHSIRLSDDHSEKRWTDDINPRTIPTPHAEMLPVIKPMVPDVSILWTDSPNNSALPSSSSATPVASSHSIGSTTPFSNAVNNRPAQHRLSYQQPDIAQPIFPIGTTQPHPQSFIPSMRPHGNQQFHSAFQNGIRTSQPYISPAHQPYFASFQNSSSLLPYPASNDSVTSVDRQNISQNSVNRNSLQSDHNFKNTSPMFHTQSQAVSYTASSYPSSCSNNQYIHSAPHPMYTPPAAFSSNNSHNPMVLSAQGQNTYLTSGKTMIPPVLGHAVSGQRLDPNQPLPAPSQSPIVCVNSISSSAPHWQSNHVSVRNHAQAMNEEIPQGTPTNPAYNSIHPNDAKNPCHPPPRNHFASVNSLKTVVEETSSNSSSSSSTTCGGCRCQSEKNMSLSNASNVPHQFGADVSMARANQSSAGNTTKSSDDDSGLSVTPERPNSSPPPPSLPQPAALDPGMISANASSSRENGSSAFGEAMNNVNWDQIPPEIKCLLIQQNEQLKLLQQQIQMLMSNQSSQSPKSTSTVGCDSATSSNLPNPPQSSSSGNLRESCTVAVNTSIPGEHQHCQGESGSRPIEHGVAGAHSSGSLLSSDLQQDSIPVQSATRSTAFDETNTSSLSNRRSSSSKSLSPRTQNDFNRSVVGGNSSASSELSKDSSPGNAAGVSEVDFNRSHMDPSYPNDSDFYNNCQDESYSTVAEEATDPRQFYDQIMNNINMFLTNGEDDSSEQIEKDEESSSSLQDSTTKFPESANSTLFPHINYMSMMLGGSSETGQSMEINAMAMKYLKDDQLTQMAMMLKQNGGSEEHSTNRLLQRMIRSGSGGNSNSSNNRLSSTDVSHLGISPNNLTMGTRNYLEKHGLLGQDSQCFNDFSALDHTFKLKTDFSIAMTDRDSDKSSANLRSVNTSPVKNYAQSPLMEPKPNPRDNIQKNFNYQQTNYPKDLGASPVLLPPKHYNMTQSPAQRPADRNRPKGRGDLFDDDNDNTDNENILDIAKLKQLPKLL